MGSGQSTSQALRVRWTGGEVRRSRAPTLSTTPPGAVTAIVVAIVVRIWFMTRPSNCIALLTNDRPEPLRYDGCSRVSGDLQTLTESIPVRVDTKNNSSYRQAGFFAAERRPGFYRTRFGFTMKHSAADLAYGMCCTLTDAGAPNRCYCGVGASAGTAAKDTEQLYEGSHGNLTVNIRCNSSEGSPAYYIARAY
jgi:hypothetical protein